MADNRQISYHILADSTQVVKTSMSYFITEGRLTVGAEALLEGPEAKHALLSRRMRTGELIEIQDQAGQRFSCQIKAVGKTELLCMVIKQVIAPNEYKTHVILCQALIAEQALDFVIQKATELGAYKVCIFQAEHSPRKLQIDKHARWNRIAAEAG
jgi:16S rRNA (uracil1498-N3)-methyltransferase